MYKIFLLIFHDSIDIKFIYGKIGLNFDISFCLHTKK